jgi:hypothetical protein
MSRRVRQRKIGIYLGRIMYFLLLKYIFVEMEKGWYSYRGSLSYANFITPISITAIFQATYLACAIFGLIPSLL